MNTDTRPDLLAEVLRLRAQVEAQQATIERLRAFVQVDADDGCIAQDNCQPSIARCYSCAARAALADTAQPADEAVAELHKQEELA